MKTLEFEARTVESRGAKVIMSWEQVSKTVGYPIHLCLLKTGLSALFELQGGKDAATRAA